MIQSFRIENYKSIRDQTIELGRINVFVGENGSGKTNLLEAMAMAAAALTDRLEVADLDARGIRVAKPSITVSSFLGQKQRGQITLTCTAREARDETVKFVLEPVNPKDFSTSWDDKTLGGRRDSLGRNLRRIGRFAHTSPGLGDFVLYNLNVLALRGKHSASLRTPLGINGENLDVHLATLPKKDMAEVLALSKLVAWVDRVVLDREDALKYKGHKLGRSTSTLYFKDRLMRRGDNIFSAENANEGILHILFYLTLFISDSTPKVFGIDNIETALNPQMCRDLMKELAALAKTHNKQALITTHNPAILDGLNLHDDEQRLFVVSRNDDGHTITERIKLKPQPQGEKYKLSELWMRGYMGGLPRRF